MKTVVMCIFPGSLGPKSVKMLRTAARSIIDGVPEGRRREKRDPRSSDLGPKMGFFIQNGLGRFAKLWFPTEGGDAFSKT